MSIARGILKGFLKQGLESRAKSDELYADMVKDVGIEFKKTSQLFQQEEKDTQKRFNLIAKAKGNHAALYASYNTLTTSDDGANLILNADETNPGFLDSIKDFDFQGYNYNTAKSSRLTNFKTQNKNAIDVLSKHQIGPNVGNLYLKPIKPKEEVVRPEGEIVRPEGEVARPDLIFPTEMSEFKPSATDDFTAKSEFRLRKNDTVKRAVDVAGLAAKFSQDNFGNISVTAVDEADQVKLNFITSEAENRYVSNPKRLDYSNAGNEAVIYANSINKAAQGFKTEMDKTFQVYNLSANKALANSEDKTIPLEDGSKITVYELFLNTNSELLRIYASTSYQGRIFIKKQYGALTPSDSGYYNFFARVDDELDQEENS